MTLKFNPSKIEPAQDEIRAFLDQCAADGAETQDVEELLFLTMGLSVLCDSRFPNLRAHFIDTDSDSFEPEGIKAFRQTLKDAGKFPETHSLLDTIRLEE